MFVAPAALQAPSQRAADALTLRSSFCGDRVRSSAARRSSALELRFGFQPAPTHTFIVEAQAGKKKSAKSGGAKRSGGDGKRAAAPKAAEAKKPATPALREASPEPAPAASPEPAAAAAASPEPEAEAKAEAKAPALAAPREMDVPASVQEEAQPKARRRVGADLKPLPEMPAFIKEATTDTRQLEQDFAGLVGTAGREEEYVVSAKDCSGSLPSELRGTFFRNGPGLVDIGKEKLHPSDGHGFVSALTFDGSSVRVRSAFVRTPVYERESKTGRIASRGFASSRGLSGAFDVAGRAVANVGCVEWGGRLLATGEGHRPFQLDPSTLATAGQDDLGGVLSKGAPLPLMKRCGDSLVAAEVENGLLSTRVRALEFDSRWKLVDSQYQELAIAGANFQDFAVSPKYVLFFQNSVSTFAPRYAAYLAGLTSRAAALRWDPNQSLQIFVVPREPRNHRRLQTDAGFVGHVGNAFDLADETRDTSGIGLGGAGERVQFDAVALDEHQPGSVDPSKPRTVPRGGLFRFTVNVQRATVLKRPLCDLSCDFPVFNQEYAGQRNRYVYAAACPDAKRAYPFQSVIKCDADVIGKTAVVSSWEVGPREFVSEAAFAPRPGAREEDDGWLLALVHDAEGRAARVAVLDARDLAPVAAVPLRGPLPLTSHVAWSPQ